MQPVNPLEYPDWDSLLIRRPDFSFFHGSAWTKILAETYGFRPVWQMTGKSLLPVMEVDSWLTGRRGVALPFTDFCPPLAGSDDDFRPLFQSATEFGRSRGWKSIELRGRQGFLREAPASLAYYGHQIELMADEARLFERMEGSARQAVRKAEKDGVTVEVSQSVEAVREFYELQCLTRKRHGLPPQPVHFFLNIHRHILSQNQGIIVLAACKGSKIAAAVYFFLGGRAIYKFGASDYRQQKLRPNNLIMWMAMKWLARNGCTRLHLGKTSLGNEGLRKFKMTLGAVEETIEYVKLNLRTNKFEVESDEVAGWHNHVFRALPVGLSRRAGEFLYKHWA